MNLRVASRHDIIPFFPHRAIVVVVLESQPFSIVEDIKATLSDILPPVCVNSFIL
jgi:hypothetical protein